MSKSTPHFVALAFLALLLVMHSAKFIDFGFGMWIACLMTILTAALIVVTPSDKELGNG